MSIDSVKDFHDEKILFVDDIYDSGKTFAKIEETIVPIYNITDYGIAVLHFRKRRKYKTPLKTTNVAYGFLEETKDWIVYPWESQQSTRGVNARNS
jgi:hypoxanthine phosphoribosyltransferase